MVDAEMPKTPTPASRTLRKLDQGAAGPVDNVVLTPPPSDRKSRSSFMASSRREQPSPSKSSLPPLMAKAPPRPGSFGSAMPSPEQIQSMPVDQLRSLANDLIPSLGEARMELAHTRLQYQLLTIETREAAQRAEVEHTMTRKEVEVLQAGSPLLQARAAISPDPRSLLHQVQTQLASTAQRASELESANAALDRRLKDAKRVIRYLDGVNLELDDRNKLLRERIRDNREHLDAMRSSGLLRSAPSSPSPKQTQRASATAHGITHYATPARPRRPEFSHTPATPTQSHSQARPAYTPHRTPRPHDTALDTLLFASTVIDTQHERASTPSPARVARQPPSHSRGSLSLSSLPQTPPPPYRFPVAEAAQQGFVGARRRSVSTISDDSLPSADRMLVAAGHGLDEGLTTEDEMPGSRASRAASEMLKRHGHGRGGAPVGLGLVQTKLTGRIVKGGNGSGSGSQGSKRAFGEVGRGKGVQESPKKQKTDGVGLGIGVWSDGTR